MNATECEIGIDTGGTFTDVVCRVGEAMHLAKIPSTPADPSAAIRIALEKVRDDWGVDPAAVMRFVHGTTVATNAVIERRGGRTGILTTEGFRDVLELGRQMRRRMYDLRLAVETPVFLAPASRRAEVRERVSAQGEVLVPLDEESLAAAVARLTEQGVESIAVCFLFSFLYPEHERRAREYIADRYPDLAVSLSSEVDPTFREYERTCVTAFDAYCKPVVDRYLGAMEHDLIAAGVPAPPQIMQSRGGLAISQVARRRPVRLFLSGPAAGVIGGRAAGAAAALGDLITLDVGGTSSDIALVAGGDALVCAESTIAGFSVRAPSVDINTLGAGGGSIAWLDDAGGLRVGPHSAGSNPGPACYGLGGTEPTVTDASLVLGYLNPANFAGGALALDPALAAAVVEERIARPMGLSLEAAALGIHTVINAQMSEGIRLVSINRGLDPRDFVLVAMGGAGPLHAVPLAVELGIARVLVPRSPGVLSAAGLLAAPIEHEVAAAFHRDIDEVDVDEVRGALGALDRRCADLMAAEGIAEDRVDVSYHADVCYVGQSYPLEVPLSLDCDGGPGPRLYRDFLAAHERVHGHSVDAPARIVNLRSVHRAAGAALDLSRFEPPVADPPAPGERPVWIDAAEGPVVAAIHDRALLPLGARVAGPAILEQADTTTLVPSGWHARVLAGGNMLIEEEGGR